MIECHFRLPHSIYPYSLVHRFHSEDRLCSDVTLDMIWQQPSTCRRNETFHCSMIPLVKVIQGYAAVTVHYYYITTTNVAFSSTIRHFFYQMPSAWTMEFWHFCVWRFSDSFLPHFSCSSVNDFSYFLIFYGCSRHWFRNRLFYYLADLDSCCTTKVSCRYDVGQIYFVLKVNDVAIFVCKAPL